MGAVALSRRDEELLNSLKEELGAPSKSEVLRRALEGLRRSLERERLAGEIARSVKRCAVADLRENAEIGPSAYARKSRS